MAKKELIKNDVLTLRLKDNPVVDALDKSLDVIEETLDRIEGEIESGVKNVEHGVSSVVTVTKNNPKVLAAVAVGSLVAGTYFGYKHGVKRTTLRFEKVIIDLGYNVPEKPVNEPVVGVIDQDGDPVVVKSRINIPKDL